MATPKNINIEFKATGNLETTLKAIAKEYAKFQNQTKQVSSSLKAHSKASAQNSEVVNQNRIEAEKLQKAMKFYNITLQDLSLKQKTFDKALQGSTKEFSLLKRATGRNLKEQREYLQALAENKARTEKLTKAQKKQAETQKILSVHAKVNRANIKKLNLNLQKMGKSFKDAGLNGEILKKALRGNAAAMGAVTKASKLLIAQTKKVRTGLFTISNDGRLLSNTFATLRSKMLLFAFASTMLSSLVLKQVRAFGKQEDSVKRLADVFGGEAAGRLDEFSSALQRNSTFGDENINILMSQIGAFGANEEQVKKLAQATVDLSAGLGVDLNTAGLLVAKTIGSTTDALTRYGVGANGATTQSEKIANVISSVEEKFGGLGAKLADTTEGQLAQAANAFGDFQENIGQVLAPALLFAARGLKAFSEAMSVGNIQRFLYILASIATVMTAHRIGLALTTKGTIAFKIANISLAKAISRARVAMNLFTKATKRNPFGLIAAIATAAIFPVLEFFGLFDDNQDAIDDAGKSFATASEEAEKLAKSIEQSEEALQEQLDLLYATSEIEKHRIRQKRELTQTEIDLIKAIEIKKKEDKEAEELLKERIKAEEHLGKVLTEVANIGINTSMVKMQTDLEMIKVERDKQQAIVDTAIANGETSEATIKANKSLRSLNEGYEKLKKIIDDYNKELEKKQKQEEFDERIQEKLLKVHSDRAAIMIANGRFEFTLAQKLEDLKEKENNALEEKNLKLISEQEYQLKLLEIAKERAAIDEQQNKIDERKTTISLSRLSQVAKLSGLLDGLGTSATSFGESFQNTYDEVLAQTGKASEATKVAWNEAGTQIAAMAIEAFSQYSQAEMDIAKKQGQQKLDSLKQSARYDKMSARQKKVAEKQIRDETNKEILKQFEIKQNISRAAVLMDTAAAVVEALPNIPLSIIVGAMGAAQLATINSQKPPKMAQGGLIGGRLHSQGGTMIEAERGEFVMSRRAVETAGLETMNRINSGMGSGGSINITFSGNINSDEFIESEAIPKIKEAIRRGADIGEV